jgi:hypothetical protein
MEMLSANYDPSQDFRSTVKLLMFVLLVAYSLQAYEINTFGISPVIAAWAGITIFYFGKILGKSFIVAAGIYVSLFWMYLVGGMNSDIPWTDLDFVRIFIPQALIAGIVSAAAYTKRASTRDLQLKFSKLPLDTIALGLILAWTYFIVRAQSSTVHWSELDQLRSDNYLTVSDLLSMLALLILSGIKGRPLQQVVWLVLVSIALMTLGSRASIVVFAVCALMAMASGNAMGRSGLRVWKIVLGLLTIAVTSILFLNYFDNNVTLRLLTLDNMGHDASADARKFNLVEYVHTVSDHPMCMVVSCFKTGGNYVHSILSVVEYFGIAGVLILVISPVTMLISWRRGWRPLCAPLFAYCAIQLVIARSWVCLVFPVFIGYLISSIVYLSQRRQSSIAANHTKNGIVEGRHWRTRSLASERQD